MRCHTLYSFSPSRFTSSKSGVLVASDVAARGLDLPAVEHIIHYQVIKIYNIYVRIIIECRVICGCGYNFTGGVVLIMIK